jgi:hypothetical protein
MNDETKIEGVGAIPHVGGVAFRVWVPNAQRLAAIDKTPPATAITGLG